MVLLIELIGWKRSHRIKVYVCEREKERDRKKSDRERDRER